MLAEFSRCHIDSPLLIYFQPPQGWNGLETGVIYRHYEIIKIQLKNYAQRLHTRCMLRSVYLVLR